MKIWNIAGLLCLISLASIFHQTNGYDSRDPRGNITIRWDVITPTPDGYVALVNITNYQKYRTVDAPGWNLTWTWAHKEVIWAVVGARVYDQGNCTRFKDFVPTSCSKTPSVFDLTAEVPPTQKIDGCCKGGALLSRLQGYAKSTAEFQISVGRAGRGNATWRMPRNHTLAAPRGEYSCSPAEVVAPTKFISADKRRITRAYMSWQVVCKYRHPSDNKIPLCCVSLSADHHDDQTKSSCPICTSCSSKDNVTRSCSTKKEHGKLVQATPSIEYCTDVKINWHVMSKVKNENQRKIRVTISNLNPLRNYSDWIVLLEHQAMRYGTKLMHANHRFLSSSQHKMEVVWGRKNYNEVLAAFGNKGSTIRFYLAFKGKAGQKYSNNAWKYWRSPNAIFFNGDYCVSPY